MTLKDIVKICLPYIVVINRRNKRKVFAQLLAQSGEKTIPIEHPNYDSIVSVQGFGYSGSGAVLDILREYKITLVLGYMDPEATQNSDQKRLAEIEIIRLPGGLFEIENNLGVQNVFLNDALFNRTIKLFESSALFSYSTDIQKLFCCFFRSITSLRIQNLKKTYYNGYLSNPDEISNIYFKNNDLTKESYLSLCRNLLITIFNRINNGSRIIVADQLFSDTDLNIRRNMLYIQNLKTIIVVRDPRDIYAWAILRDIEWIAHNSVEDFINWYKIQYANVSSLKKSSDCIVIDYESLILDYENVIRQVEEYLSLRSEMHVNKKHYFDPTFSKKFVGIYKDSNKIEDMNVIRESLSVFCNPVID